MANSDTNPFAQGYNDRFRSQGQGQGQQGSPSRLEQTQAQVQDVVTIMKSNVEKVMERDSRLSELDDRAEALNNSSQMFQRTSNQIRRKMWWNNLKWKILLGLVIVAVIVGLGFWIASSFKSDDGGDSKALQAIVPSAQPAAISDSST